MDPWKERDGLIANSFRYQYFADQSFTIEDVMRSKGELVKRGSISDGGDVEFWGTEADNTTKARQEERSPKGA